MRPKPERFRQFGALGGGGTLVPCAAPAVAAPALTPTEQQCWSTCFAFTAGCGAVDAAGPRASISLGPGPGAGAGAGASGGGRAAASTVESTAEVRSYLTTSTYQPYGTGSLGGTPSLGSTGARINFRMPTRA